MGDQLETTLKQVAEMHFGPLDFLPYNNVAEKIIELVLCGPPKGLGRVTSELTALAQAINSMDTSDLNVVVFGGGTGLSNLVGGDSRNPGWPRNPFHGLKRIFPKLRSIVCVTDDGGSTGELLKELPLIALGDLRHVLLSSVQESKLQRQYGLDEKEALKVAAGLHVLFNFRFAQRPEDLTDLLGMSNVDLQIFPDFMRRSLVSLLEALFADDRLSGQLARPHCLGNLLLAAAIYLRHDSRNSRETVPPTAVMNGLRFLSDLVGADPDAVMPCTTTPAHLKILYSNGVLVTGEYKSALARRNCPVDRVFVEFAGEPHVPPEVLDTISRADIILFAPGSLYTSIIPILQVPGIAEAIRKQRQAIKILVSNLWVQKGETDLVSDDPRRRFYVSDMIKAYQQNIPGGVDQLCHQIMTVGLREIPGSILQRYAVEGKYPIYLDRERVRRMGFTHLEAKIYSPSDIAERRVLQHDPASITDAMRAVWAVREMLPKEVSKNLPVTSPGQKSAVNGKTGTPNQRYSEILDRLEAIEMERGVREELAEIFWNHWDIPLGHLEFFKGVQLIDKEVWDRCQEWDKVYSFYEPADGLIRVRHDIYADPMRFEVAFLVALGESLLGNYAAQKENILIERDGETLGKVYRLTMRPEDERNCFFTTNELDQYLDLSRMNRAKENPLVYTRLVNGNEGFTPPGLLFGLTYAWYLDNRFASHIEYKMSILNIQVTDLIAEQNKIYNRRRALVDFFRTVVFQYKSPEYNNFPPQ